MRIEVNGVERRISARRQRAVLACLVLHLGEAVSADRLLEDIWGDAQPDSGVKAVAYQISMLRKLLEPDRVGEGSVITTTPAGYVLNVDRDHVDMHEFDRLVDLAREAVPTDPSAAQALIEQALGLRRGRPFADLDDDFVEIESRRIEARQFLARTTLAECRLAQGHSADVVGELERMAAEQPLEESVAQLLMTALHRSGRTADGLRVYGELRKRLSAELGIEPSGQLQHLELQLLAGESAPVSTPDHEFAPTRDCGTVGQSAHAPVVVRRSNRRDPRDLRTVDEPPSRVVAQLRRGRQDPAGDRGRGQPAWIATATVSGSSTWSRSRRRCCCRRPSSPASDFPRPGATTPRHTCCRSSRLATHWSSSTTASTSSMPSAISSRRLVRTAPDVRVLATSRLGLGVPDEVMWHVQPLELTTAAFELFTQRSRLVRPGFQVDDSNRGDDRTDLRTSRRDPARDRARQCTSQDDDRRPGRRPSRRPLPAADPSRNATLVAASSHSWQR